MTFGQYLVALVIGTSIAIAIARYGRYRDRNR